MATEAPAELVATILAAISRWKRAAVRTEASWIARKLQGDERFAPFETLALAFMAAADALENLPNPELLDGDTTGDLRAAYALATSAFIGSAHAPPSPQQIEALGRLTNVATSARARADVVEPSDTVIFQAGALSADELAAELAIVVSSTDWSTAEAMAGTPIPGAVRRAPVEIDAHADGSDGRATLAVRFAGWASAPVREGVQRLLEQAWLPQIRSQSGEGAVGEPDEAAAAPDAHVCRILFGTNRDRQEDGFGTDCADTSEPLTFGSATVSVPNRRKRGGVQRPWSIPGLARPERADKHIVLLQPPEILTREAFVAAARAAAHPGGAFLFVHGFNTSFEGGLWRTAQLATDLEVEGPVFHYAWPSAGRPWLYDYDSENVKASRTPFKAFVNTILDDAGVTALNVVAHSKGNELVLEAFADLAAEAKGVRRAASLVLASPDVDIAVGKDRLKRAPSFFSSVTLYANKYDRPLVISARKARRARLGGEMKDHHPFIAEGVDTIDAANTDFAWFGLNHDAYVDAPILRYDLSALLKKGVRPPNDRSPVIRPMDCERGRYYQVATD